ncbi:MAG: RdgB/HAM1 family non-canonical purine NTP pyrophosphatase [Pseudohongiella sp.]|nr:RdgB/HAM1 family non-canonical purine NTP pyrophosphatase [Pseudohongiella sp.]MDO9519088.1 RdgB/HAM1 family non-canonical purine NTP pyrophosphatase [Pseudohongiella sp.]MDP2129093.1 RdgB/HAM1 family non-canonical purine NTP pyrophosphatase [Pseudohongiella sp.]
MQKIVLASSNAGKLKELQFLLSALPVLVVAQSELGIDDAEETGLTFIENAILKARHASAISGLPAIADDSGLAVDALGGAPGIYSARYAELPANIKGVDRDQGNNLKLLNALKDIPDDNRGAQFHCVLVYLRHAADPTPLVCHGQWRGTILHKAAGDNGFGYDPLFLVPERGCSSAELSAADKNQLSHRAQASRMLLDALKSRYGIS